ncbi:hypothetical protein ABFX02_05G070600 [Erythranthe guttata]
MATAGSIQPMPPPPSPPLQPPLPPVQTYTYPPIIIVLTIVLLIFFFVGFFSVYFCRCFMQNILCTWHIRHSPAGTPVAPANPAAAGGLGLDPLIVQSFPTFLYSTVKEYRKDKYGLECAICLIEFEGSDSLRFLTTCCHVFHQECIDLWLESHKTCPVCRRSLDGPVHTPAKSPIFSGNETERVGDSVRITIDNDEERGGGGGGGGDKGQDRVSCSNNNDENDTADKLCRSHSTGHSIVRNREHDDDRFTLRLPEHVKTRIIVGHSSSKSWTAIGEYKDKDKDKNVGLAEVSDSGNKDS